MWDSVYICCGLSQGKRDMLLYDLGIHMITCTINEYRLRCKSQVKRRIITIIYKKMSHYQNCFYILIVPHDMHVFYTIIFY